MVSGLKADFSLFGCHTWNRLKPITRRRARAIWDLAILGSNLGPPENELVIAECVPTGYKFFQHEAPGPAEFDHGRGSCHFERIPTEPINSVMRSGHASLTLLVNVSSRRVSKLYQVKAKPRDDESRNKDA